MNNKTSLVHDLVDNLSRENQFPLSSNRPCLQETSRSGVDSINIPVLTQELVEETKNEKKIDHEDWQLTDGRDKDPSSSKMVKKEIDPKMVRLQSMAHLEAQQPHQDDWILRNNSSNELFEGSNSSSSSDESQLFWDQNMNQSFQHTSKKRDPESMDFEDLVENQFRSKGIPSKDSIEDNQKAQAEMNTLLKIELSQSISLPLQKILTVARIILEKPALLLAYEQNLLLTDLVKSSSINSFNSLRENNCDICRNSESCKNCQNCQARKLAQAGQPGQGTSLSASLLTAFRALSPETSILTIIGENSKFLKGLFLYDKLLLMDGGQIIEQGSLKKMLKKKEEYRQGGKFREYMKQIDSKGLIELLRELYKRGEA